MKALWTYDVEHTSKSMERRCYPNNIISLYLPVVMSADLNAAGDQSGWSDLSTAIMPDTCGQAIDVPESKK